MAKLVLDSAPKQQFVLMTLDKQVPKISKAGELGSMLVFDKCYPEGHELATKRVCKWMGKEETEKFDLSKYSTEGWRYSEGGYINPPLIDVDYKLDRAAAKGMGVNI
jgi:hypothetical protein